MQTPEEYRALLSAVSHEIRNPVTLISSYLQLMSKKHPEVCGYPYWNTIQDEMEHLKNLLRDISSYQNGFCLHKIPTDPGAWLDHYARSTAALLSQRPGITFFCHIEKKLPSLPLDQDKLRQVLDNLVRNSLDALESAQSSSPKGTSGSGDAAASEKYEGCLSLRAWQEGDALLLSVSDTGCGISPEYSKTMFEPFVTHKPEGTGLGLAICRQIIDAHGGEIKCVSENQPTEFQISLPIESPR